MNKLFLLFFLISFIPTHLLVHGVRLAEVERTFFGQHETEGFKVKMQECDVNQDISILSYEIHLKELYEIKEFYASIHYKLNHLSSSSLVKLRAGALLENKDNWPTYTTVVVRSTGYYNLQGDAKNAEIQYVVIEWENHGVLDQMCIFSAKVSSSNAIIRLLVLINLFLAILLLILLFFFCKNMRARTSRGGGNRGKNKKRKENKAQENRESQPKDELENRLQTSNTPPPESHIIE